MEIINTGTAQVLTSVIQPTPLNWLEFFLSPAGDVGPWSVEGVPWSVEGVSIGRSLLHMSLSLQHLKVEVCVSNRPLQTPILSRFACSIVSMQPRMCSKVFVVSESLICRKQE